jgi:uncharacterized membrane protein YfcA
MSKLTPERRKIVAIGGSVAAMSGGVLLLQRNHPWLTAVWACLLMFAAIYVMMQLVKIRRSARRSRSEGNNR